MAGGGGGFLNITVQFEGQRELIGKFATWGANIQTMRPAWEDVGNLLLLDFAQQFEAEGGYLGAGVAPVWPPLAPSTIRDRLAKGYGPGPKLVRTGQLMGSVTQRGANGNIFELGDNSVRAGTSYPIARYHQYGTRKMPQRKMIGLAWKTRSSILRILGDYVRAQAAQAGLPLNG